MKHSTRKTVENKKLVPVPIISHYSEEFENKNFANSKNFEQIFDFKNWEKNKIEKTLVVPSTHEMTDRQTFMYAASVSWMVLS